MDPETAAKVFVEQICNTLDPSRANIGTCQEAAMIAFEMSKHLALASIISKLTELLFQDCKHSIGSHHTCDFPSRPVLGSHERVLELRIMDTDTEAKNFVEQYYNTFDDKRAYLGRLYGETSKMTFEGEKHQGPTSIVEKLMGLPFQQCKHVVSTLDCQPSGPAGSILVYVSGMLLYVSGSPQIALELHQRRFSQSFNLVRTSLGGLVIENDIFRLNHG
jgi:hypothetical protein